MIVLTVINVFFEHHIASTDTRFLTITKKTANPQNLKTSRRIHANHLQNNCAKKKI